MPQASILIRDLRLLVLPMTMVFLLGAAGAGACLGWEICLVTLGPPWLLSPKYDAWNYLELILTSSPKVLQYRWRTHSNVLSESKIVQIWRYIYR